MAEPLASAPHSKDGDGMLGGLANLPNCRELLIRKHTVELERVMRLLRALVQQMKGQVRCPMPIKHVHQGRHSNRPKRLVKGGALPERWQMIHVVFSLSP